VSWSRSKPKHDVSGPLFRESAEGIVKELILRFVVGGLVVSAFAALGDALKPKSFAGLIGAAPSIALATLGMAIIDHGRRYAAIEAHSMIAGAVSFWLYAHTCSWIMMRHKVSAAAVVLPALGVWLACSITLWLVILR
jgi:hypothetical protein